jgi:hypothetical protein
MLVPVVIGIGTGYAWWKHHKSKSPNGMTPKRKAIFEAALKDPKLSSEKLLALAKSFDSCGLRAEGDELRKRAAIIGAPPALLASRKVTFKKAMSSTNQTAVQKVAAAFHAIGHYEAASKLRNYAKGLMSHTSAGE